MCAQAAAVVEGMGIQASLFLLAAFRKMNRDINFVMSVRRSASNTIQTKRRI
jgi:hypothetical protein